MVTVLGMPLPLEKVHREVQRYNTIPTARDFGRDGENHLKFPLKSDLLRCKSDRDAAAPSPPNPARDIVRVVTPSPSEFKNRWPANLPWLKFIQDFDLSKLRS
jgi:hypothetical protein